MTTTRQPNMPDGSHRIAIRQLDGTIGQHTLSPEEATDYLRDPYAWDDRRRAAEPCAITPPRVLHFTVNATAAPQGSKRHVGKGILVESSKRVKPYREAVRYAALESGWDRETFDGPVAVEIHFYFTKPKSAPKRRRVWPITRSTGDLDKLVRSTFDALDDVGVLSDDSIVCRLVCEKDYAERAWVEISVTAMDYPSSP